MMDMSSVIDASLTFAAAATVVRMGASMLSSESATVSTLPGERTCQAERHYGVSSYLQPQAA